MYFLQTQSKDFSKRISVNFQEIVWKTTMEKIYENKMIALHSKRTRDITYNCTLFIRFSEILKYPSINIILLSHFVWHTSILLFLAQVLYIVIFVFTNSEDKISARIVISFIDWQYRNAAIHKCWKS